MSIFILCYCFCLTTIWAAVGADDMGPPSGSIYKEFYVNPRGGDWRVTDPDARAAGAQNWLPNPVLVIEGVELENAVRAELLIDRWGGHIGTSGKQVRFNGNNWLDVPTVLFGVEREPTCYLYQDNPIIDIPLGDLVEGDNFFEATSDDQICLGSGWGQWGWYLAMLRIYYPEDAPHTSGYISNISTGDTLLDNPVIEVATDPENTHEEIIVLGYYEGVDADGDGLRRDWHRMYHYARIRGHVGTIPAGSNSLTWDTSWIPDQEAGTLKLAARIKSTDGAWYITPVVENLTLERTTHSVKMYKVFGAGFGVRASNRRSVQFHIPSQHDLALAEDAQIFIRMWNGAGNEQGHTPMAINQNPFMDVLSGSDHNFSMRWYDVPLEQFIQGANVLHFMSTSSDHASEILWSGPDILIRYAEFLYNPPLIEWISPSAQLEWDVGETVHLEIAGSSPNGPVDSVTFKLNGEPLVTLTAPPYAYEWTASEMGIHEITAEITDSVEASATTEPLSIIVGDVKPQWLTEEIPAGTIGMEYAYNIAYTRGNGATALEVTSGNLPAGLNLENSGLLSGVPEESLSAEIVLRLTDNNGDVTSRAFTIRIHDKDELGSGSIFRELWHLGNCLGVIEGLTEDSAYPDTPFASGQISTLQLPMDWSECYGARIRGYLHPPETGKYTFSITADDAGELWLNTSAEDPENPELAQNIANTYVATPEFVFDQVPSQTSEAFLLEEGKRYYLEIIYKEGTHSDHMKVAWKGPGLPQQIIDGVFLSPYVAATNPWLVNNIALPGSYGYIDSFIGIIYYDQNKLPWIYHPAHGYLYAYGSDRSSVWFYAADIGFFWTAEYVYPWIYHSATDDWYYYLEDMVTPRQFVKGSTGETMDVMSLLLP